MIHTDGNPTIANGAGDRLAADLDRATKRVQEIGYRVNGTRELADVAAEALAALPLHCSTLHVEAECAEFRADENEPVKATIWDGFEFKTYVWTRKSWIEQ